jgi:CxxC-x17-CxxC domain-containing protein
MKKHIKDKKVDEVPLEIAPDIDMVGILNKIQQQLTFLEKKIDSLIGKPASPAYSSQPARPFQHPGHSHGRDDGRQGNSYRERTLHRAICAECKKECEVPFRPTGDRPVYCKDCFSKRRKESPFQERSDNAPRKESGGYRKQSGGNFHERHFNKKPWEGHKSSGDKKKAHSRKRKSK